MPRENVPESHIPNWTFRFFLLFVVALLLGSVGWLIWAAVQFGPTSDSDILTGLLRDDIFATPGILLTRQNSDCQTRGSAKGSISADLYVSFTEANAGAAPNPVELIGLNPKQRVVDASQTPQEWYESEGVPVVSISNIGMTGRVALVCIDVFAREDASYFVKLYRRTANRWEVVEEIVVWQEEPVEEIPVSRIPEVSY